MIHPLACVHPGAKIDETAIIGPFVYIEDNVEIGAGTEVMANASVMWGSRIGRDCKIFPSAVVGAIPQDLKFKGEETLAIIGDRTVLRECATVHRGTASKGKTVVGNDCLIMAYCHVAHDCNVGDGVIMSNSIQMAGEVVVDPFAVIGGGTLIHQFTHIGSYCMIQGGSGLTKDIPPYTMVGRSPAKYMGLNTVGLRRRGFSAEKILNIQEIYRLVYASGYNTTHACEHIEAEIAPSEERDYILNFIRTSDRGIIAGNMM